MHHLIATYNIIVVVYLQLEVYCKHAFVSWTCSTSYVGVVL